jgi:hypothetical protein
MLEDLLINRYLMRVLDRSIEGARNVDARSGDWRERIVRNSRDARLSCLKEVR